MLDSDARRVTGDLFKDCILDSLMFGVHPFSVMAARGEMDEAVYHAMRGELNILQLLSTLDSETVLRWTHERFRDLKAKPKRVRDQTSAMASAASVSYTHLDVYKRQGPTRLWLQRSPKNK